MIASVNVEFFQKAAFVDLLRCLQEAGWGFPDGVVAYDHYREVTSIGQNYRSLSIPEWLNLQSEVTDYITSGEHVLIVMKREDFTGNFQFSPNDGLFVSFDATRPILNGFEPFTDFSYFVKTVVWPLYLAGNKIARVGYSDDFN